MDRLMKLLKENPIIASVNSMGSLHDALESPYTTCIMLKFGDINTIHGLVREVHRAGKTSIVHFDAMRGIAKDPYGIKFLARTGTDGINTTKPQWVRAIQDAGCIALQVMFIVDTEAVSAGIESLNKNRPDVAILMPIGLPDEVVQTMRCKTKRKFIAGGLLMKPEDISVALQQGFQAVVTSRPELWKLGNNSVVK